jgi:PAS domain S-box-containing protein
MLTSGLLRRFSPSATLNYGIAILSVAVALGAGLVLQSTIGVAPSVSLFLCAIMFIAWIGGTGPGLFAIALTVLAFDYFFLRSAHSFSLSYEDVPRLALFTVAALFVVALSAAQRRAEASLRRIRDEQQETVRELQRLNETLRLENAERKRAEEKIRRAEQELQATIDTIPALAARYRPDGSMDFVNQTWRDYTGLSQESLGRQRWGVAIHPDDQPRVEHAWLAHLAGGEPFDIEQRLRRADGEYRWHWVRRVPLRDDNGELVKWYGVGFEIEDQKRAEDALRRSEARLAESQRELQLMIDTIPALVTVFRRDGEREFVNQTWRDYTGFQLTDIQGGGWRTVVHPDDHARSEEAWRDAVATGEPVQLEHRIRRADGEFRWHMGRRVPLRDETGNIIRWYGVGTDIEDQKRAEAAARRSEAHLAKAQRELQLMIDTIPALVTVFRPDGEREFVNKTWRDNTGLQLEDIQNEGWRINVHPDDQERSERLWREAIATGEPLEIEHRIRGRDGEYRWHMGRRVPLRDDSGEIIRWYSVGTDIEDQKRAEEALRRSEAKLAATIDTIPVLVSSYGPDGRRDFVNAAWRHFTGLSPEQALGTEWFSTVHPDDIAEGELRWREALAKGQAMRMEQRFRRADGAYRWFLVDRVPLHDETGRVIKWYATGYEIEDQKRAEGALHAAQAELAHASRVTTLGEMSASIAHEVNQPLAAIVANGEACRRWLDRGTPDLDEVRGCVEWIIKDGYRAGEVIRRVRALSNKAEIQKAPLDINDTIKEVITLLQRELAAHHVLLRTELGAALPLVFADRVQLQQVVINLVMNGIEAMQSVENRPRDLIVRSYEDDAHQVVVAVKDSGIGIAAASADRMFDAFFSTKPGGLGMGLSICRSIIEVHGGRLSASSNGGSGATFQFALPSYREEAA